MTYVIRPAEELHKLREEYQVMRNLLRDIAENEASLGVISSNTPHEVQVRLISGRILRRKELCAEIDAVLACDVP